MDFTTMSNEDLAALLTEKKTEAEGIFATALAVGIDVVSIYIETES